MALPADEKSSIIASIQQWKGRKPKTTLKGSSAEHGSGTPGCAFQSKSALRSHPLFNDIRMGVPLLEKYDLHDAAFISIHDKLSSKLQPHRPPRSSTEECKETGGVEVATPPGCADDIDVESFSEDIMVPQMEWGTSQQMTSGRNEAQTPGTVSTDAYQKGSLFGLHQRVWRWRDKVDKWIQFSMNLEPFSIPAYLTRIADHLSQRKTADEQERRTIDFRRMVQNQRKHDVCRLFLTTLVLANQHSFQLRNSVDEDGVCNLLVDVGTISATRLTQDYFHAAQDDSTSNQP
eukprot:Protomagalhaensia_sp_Gyna_25__1293@NODE_164_length_4703_cov_23_826973_g127_i0_p3_GENE_NODE_164_length_4703_cov_23_826973_g127_i0NODE_164_length_4703_cov_23_826973_g127_i0_p3_ORF_typecomplete_len290_score28_98CNDH2_C/PF16858_5/2_5e20Rad21_Rec8/PF04824_16/0_034WWE/PF02825_20/0_67_NODE_164_length_4703_cov_23_826973_g127_i030803949